MSQLKAETKGHMQRKLPKATLIQVPSPKHNTQRKTFRNQITSETGYVSKPKLSQSLATTPAEDVGPFAACTLSARVAAVDTVTVTFAQPKHNLNCVPGTDLQVHISKTDYVSSLA